MFFIILNMINDIANSSIIIYNTIVTFRSHLAQRFNWRMA